MFREVHTQAIEERASAPEIRALLQRYRGLADPSGTVTYDRFNLSILDDYRDHMMVLVANGDGDFMYMHYGRNVVSGAGTDMTGRRISELPMDIATFSSESYQRALAEGIPLYTVHRSAGAVKVSLWERLVLPVKSASGQHFIFVFTKALQFREELLSAILDSSQNGIIALEAIRGPDGSVDDAIIVTANRSACEICGHSSEALIGASALTVLPILRRSTVWTRCLEAITDGQSSNIEAHARIGGRDHWFQVSLAPLRDGVAMTFADVTELKLANLTLQSRAATLAVEIGRERAAAEMLTSEISRQKERQSELQHMADTDPMTGLLNRRSFQNRLEAIYAKARTTGQPICLAIVDLDHFKVINDSYGHPAGDAVIKAAAERLMSRIRREGDVVARIGGEEFAIVLDNARLEGAVRVAEALRLAIAEGPVALPDGRVTALTASIGVAEWLKSEDIEALFNRADEALYAAKGMGRNRVEIARRNSLRTEVGIAA
jgi:diguanylate cyclase (GGDEF)-like protein/PAS domain S-box-containing protein